MFKAPHPVKSPKTMMSMGEGIERRSVIPVLIVYFISTFIKVSVLEMS